MLNPFELIAKLPKPTDVLAGLLEAPHVLRDKNLLAAHVSYRMAQIIAVAVRQMSEQEAWVSESAQPYLNRVVDVVLPIMNVSHTLRWQVVAQDVLLAQRIEPEFDARTLTVSPANVTLTVLPSVYEVLGDFSFEAGLDMTMVMDHVHISGQPALAEWVNRLVKNLRPDVWAQLSSVIGATPAGWVQHGVNQARQHAQAVGAHLKKRCLDGDETHPAIALRHARLSELSEHIQVTRAQVEALATRVKRLAQQLNKA